MSKNKLPAHYNPSGYRLFDRVPDHTLKPVGFSVYLSKQEGTEITEGEVDVLARIFNFDNKGAGQCLEAALYNGHPIIIYDSTLEVCEAKRDHAEDKIRKLRAARKDTYIKFTLPGLKNA